MASTEEYNLSARVNEFKSGHKRTEGNYTPVVAFAENPHYDLSAMRSLVRVVAETQFAPILYDEKHYDLTRR